MREKGHSQEFELLLQCCRAYLGTGSLTFPTDTPLDEYNILSLTKTHRIGNIVAKQMDGLPANASTKQHLKNLSRDNKQRSLKQCQELLKLHKLLTEAGVDFITLKGVLLSQQIHGDFSLRNSRDIDILVKPEALLSTYQAFQKAGLEQLSPTLKLNASNFATYTRLTNQISFTSAEGQKVELHWSLFKEREALPHSMQEVWQRAQEMDFMGQKLKVLDHDMVFEYLYMHGARHHYYNLFWLMDVAKMVREMDVKTLQRQIDFAQNHDLLRPLSLSLALMEELFSINIEADYSKAPPFDKQFNYSLHILKESKALPATLANHWRLLQFRTSLKRNRTYKGDHFKLYSIKDYQVLPLPSYLRWTFLLLRPFLLASRYLRRS